MAAHASCTESQDLVQSGLRSVQVANAGSSPFQPFASRTGHSDASKSAATAGCHACDAQLCSVGKLEGWPEMLALKGRHCPGPSD